MIVLIWDRLSLLFIVGLFLYWLFFAPIATSLVLFSCLYLRIIIFITVRTFDIPIWFSFIFQLMLFGRVTLRFRILYFKWRFFNLLNWIHSFPCLLLHIGLILLNLCFKLLHFDFLLIYKIIISRFMTVQLISLGCILLLLIRILVWLLLFNLLVWGLFGLDFADVIWLFKQIRSLLRNLALSNTKYITPFMTDLTLCVYLVFWVHLFSVIDLNQWTFIILFGWLLVWYWWIFWMLYRLDNVLILLIVPLLNIFLVFIIQCQKVSILTNLILDALSPPIVHSKLYKVFASLLHKLG